MVADIYLAAVEARWIVAIAYGLNRSVQRCWPQLDTQEMNSAVLLSLLQGSDASNSIVLRVSGLQTALFNSNGLFKP